jgi:peptide/nickel transport system substrate-binding protein
LQIDFTLRDDIYFSDGEPITADDVVFTYKTIVTPGVDAASLANYYKDIDHVEKLDERRVKFVMKQVYFKSLEFTGGMEILPEHVYKFDDAQEFNIRRDNPVGSGPYVLDKWEMGREIVLKRNDNYWGKQPNVKKIVYKVITNDVAALQSLRSHDVDFLRPLPEQYFELSKDEDFTDDFRCMSYWTPSAGYFYIGWNSGSPYFADAKVRLAMTHLVDRESILKFLLKTPEARIPVGPFYINGAQTNPAIKAWPFDVARAAKLLDEAGWVDSDGDGLRDKNGVPFRFRYMIGSGVLIHEQVAKLVKDAGAKVGIDISLEPYEWSVFIQKLHDRDFDAVSLAWGGGGLQSDPYQIWHSSQSAGGGSNYVGFGDEETDGLIELARRTLDENERNKLYHRLGDIIHREQPYTFIYTRPEQRFLDKRFENVILHKLGLNQFEWYVPKVDQKY